MALSVAFLYLLGPQAVNLPGQLLAGDPTLNKEYPTTLHAFQQVTDEVHAASSMSFWVITIVVGVTLSFLLLKYIGNRFVLEPYEQSRVTKPEHPPFA